MGAEAVREYFASLPEHHRAVGLTLSYAYEIGEQMVGGFADLTFSDPDASVAVVLGSPGGERRLVSWA